MSDVNEVTQEASDKELEAAFAASFNDAPEPIVETPKAEVSAEVVEEKPAEKPEEKPEEKAVETPPPSGLTSEQQQLLAAIPELEKRLTQQVDKVAGNYGELKRLLGEMKKAAATPEGAASAEASDAWKELEEEWPEISPRIAKGVNSEVEKAVARAVANIPKGADPTEISRLVKEAVISARQEEEVNRQNEAIDALDKAHPDRLQLQETPEFKQWLGSMSPSKQAKLTNTWDMEYVAERLDEFKDWRAQQEKSHQKSKQRIEAAVTPNGVRPTGPSTVTEDEAMLKAFAAAFNEK